MIKIPKLTKWHCGRVLHLGSKDRPLTLAQADDIIRIVKAYPKMREVLLAVEHTYPGRFAVEEALGEKP